MPKGKAIEFYELSQSRAIDFHIRLDDLQVLDLVAFVLLVETKFDGAIEGRDRFTADSIRADRASIKVGFPEVMNYLEAKDHCRAHLEGDGVKRSYRGALDRMDPGRLQAEVVRDEILRLKPTNLRER